VAATEHSLWRKTFCDTRKVMGAIDIFVPALAAAVPPEDRLQDSHERIIGEDTFKRSTLKTQMRI
jgi:hypothetical protein